MDSFKESIGSQFFNVLLPTVIVLIAVGISLSIDLCTQNDFYWFQRSGALMGATGIYIAFHETSQRITSKGGTVNINTKIWYQWLGLSLGLLGTITWAYGDIPFK